MWRWILFGIGFVFGIPFGRWYLQKLRIVPFKVFQLAAHPPFPASDKGWGKELGQVQA